jgi:hypothetical protein
VPGPAITDPQRTERFRQELERHTAMTRAGLDRIHNNLSRLSAHWKDEQFNRFRDSLSRTSERLGLFLDKTRKQIAHLDEVVRHAQELGRGDSPQ